MVLVFKRDGRGSGTAQAPKKPRGAITKFQPASTSSRPSLSSSTKIPRLNTSQGIGKKGKSTLNRKSYLGKPQTSAVKAKTTNQPVETRETKRSAKMETKFVKPSENLNRKVLSNLSNSPVVSTRIPKEEKLSPKKEQKELFPTFEDQKDIDFEVDPSSLASILNNKPINFTRINQDGKHRPSSVANNCLLFPDGRPSLCRRVPIELNKGDCRASMTGPGRRLSTKKAPRPSTTQKKTFLNPVDKGSRHSLYSVIKKGFSHAPTSQKVQIGRQSLQQGRKTAQPTVKIVNDLKPINDLQTKSPGAQRILSRKNEVRISASPALRVAFSAAETPPPGRSAKKGKRTKIKWADENDPQVQDKLAVHLFGNSPSTPTVSHRRLAAKTPVSILKSRNRKHAKRNSLTPPVTKKDRLQSDSAEDGCAIEIVDPRLLNDDSQSPCLPTALSRPNTRASQKPKQQQQLHRQQQQQTLPAKPRRNLPVTKEKLPSPKSSEAATIKNQSGVTQQKVVPVDEVLSIMTRHMSSVKRRSVQAEFRNVIEHVAKSLAAPPTIQEEPADSTDPDIEINDSEKSQEIGQVSKSVTPITKDRLGGSTEALEVPKVVGNVLTPENMRKLQESYEETNRSLDEIAMATERVNRELEQLKLDKEKLKDFREQMKLKRQMKEAAASIISPHTCIAKQQATSQGKDGLSLDSVVDVDLQAGLLEFRLDSDSPILSGKLEFAPKSRNVAISDKPNPAVTWQEVIATDENSANPVKSSPENSDRFARDNDSQRAATDSKKDPSPSFVFSSRNYHAASIQSDVSSAKTSPSIISRALADPIVRQMPSPAFNDRHSHENPLLSPAETRLFRELNLGGKKSEKSPLATLLGKPHMETSTPENDAKPSATAMPSSVLTPSGNSPPAPSIARASSFKPSPCPSLSTVGCPTPGSNSKKFPNTVDPSISSEGLTFKANQPSSPEASFGLSDIKLRSRSIERNRTLGSVVESCAQSASKESNPNSKTNASIDTFNQFDLSSKTIPTPNLQEGNFLHPSCVNYPVALRLPVKTPQAIRWLKSKYSLSPYRESPKSKMKQQFAQVLLDEEVSLLTCRVVRPGTLLHNKPMENPVATSLSAGDDQHFVPIAQTPTQKKSPSSCNTGSAFTAYNLISK